MKAYRTKNGTVLEHGEEFRSVAWVTWNELFVQDDLEQFLAEAWGSGRESGEPSPADLLPLVDRQEVWAAGVTYFRSRDARMYESRASGGDTFYDKVYAADRPELFYKGNSRTVVAAGADVRIRADSEWNIPEPELTLVVDNRGRIVGYTIGNDMSSRDIEGANPLYLPQAKVYAASCALGPCILVRSSLPAPETAIRLRIRRGSHDEFAGDTTTSELKRDPVELVQYLFRDNPFPAGVFLLTGTGIIPGDRFTLEPGDEVSIQIDGIGTLTNRVVCGGKQ